MRISKSEFTKKINKARRIAEKAQLAEEELFEYLDECFPNTDLEYIPSFAENADNVKHAITCYISYGEYNINGIYEELRMVDTKGDNEYVRH